ncbi:hypothetical protein DSUL_20507 [Desulfovibrionales bacterium]
MKIMKGQPIPYQLIKGIVNLRDKDMFTISQQTRFNREPSPKIVPYSLLSLA